jgi:hypothetical protein
MLAAPAAAAAAIVLVHGTVLLGPTSPVCRVGTPCTKPAAHALLEFTQTNRIRTAWTDAKGHYTVRLEPGTWAVSSNAGLGVTPKRFIVRRGVRTQQRNLLVDTGIR